MEEHISGGEDSAEVTLEAEVQLCDCLDLMDWAMFKYLATDLNEYTN